MLNRIYIVVGLLAIIVLAGAFIAPNFIRWSDYRGRMEELATSVLGTPVTVRGEIDFTLLPQPRLRFSDVLVGSPEEPAATVDNVEAEFSLMDFLRDNYNVTRLVLNGPVVDFSVDESGFFGSGVSLAEGSGGVGLGQTSIEGGTIRLMDRRSGETFVADDVSGDLRLSGFSGPFSFQGRGTYRDIPYALRFNSGSPDGTGRAPVSMFVQPQAAGFSLSLEGLLAGGMAPKFEGDLVYRQKPPIAETVDDIHGDLLIESKVTGSTDRIVLSGYTLRPDENRAGTRLTGAASVQLGDERSFDAVISGGVFALPPRDAKEDTASLPYEVVRLLSELPAPIIPPMAGRVGIDLAEVGLRGFSLRNVRVDATTDGTSWEIGQFTGQLPGDTVVQARGQLTAESDAPVFRGDATVTSVRLDALAALWRRPPENDPLFNEPGSLAGQVRLGGGAFGLVGGVLTLNGAAHKVEARLGFGDERRLDLVAHFGELGSRGSALVAAMMPQIAGDRAFEVSFPVGSFSLTGESATVFGLAGTGLVADGEWHEGGASLSRLAAGDWGGVGFDATMAVAGTLAEPEISGSAMVRVARGDAPALIGLHDLLEVPQSWRDFLAASAPADLVIDVGALFGGRQTVTAAGTLGAGLVNLRAEIDGGIGQFGASSLRVTGALESTEIEELSRQVGLGDALFSGDGSMLVSMVVEGTPANGLDASLAASLGDESLSYWGDLLVAQGGEIRGTGTVASKLADASGLAGLFGATGLTLPALDGSAQVSFEGARQAKLAGISGRSGDTAFTGELLVSRTGGVSTVSGDVAVDMVSVEGLAAALLGPAALVGGSDAWPDGPLSLPEQPRRTRGGVNVSAGSLWAGGVERLGKTSFELSWDETRTRLARLTAAVDLGSVNLDVVVCCAGPLAGKTISGRLSIVAAPLDVLAPPEVAGMLDGLLAGGVQFQGAGASLAEVMGNMTGEGNFTVSDFSVAQLSPGVYPTVAGFDSVLTMEPDAMATVLGMALRQGDFTTRGATGAFTIAGGVVRLANLIIDGVGARLAGDVSLALADLGLGGSFVMTPRDFVDERGMVGADSGRIVTRLGGTLLAPVVTLGLDEIIAAVLVRANELEVDRLEALRAEDAERQRAAAEERNRLIAEQRRRAAEEAARLEAEEAARLAAEEEARLAAEEEARRLELQQAPQPTPAPSIQTLPSQQQPLDLSLPPPRVEQPFGTSVNQPMF